MGREYSTYLRSPSQIAKQSRLDLVTGALTGMALDFIIQPGTCVVALYRTVWLGWLCGGIIKSRSSGLLL